MDDGPVVPAVYDEDLADGSSALPEVKEPVCRLRMRRNSSMRYMMPTVSSCERLINPPIQRLLA